MATDDDSDSGNCSSAESTAPKLRLLGESLTLGQALARNDRNMVHEAGYVAATKTLLADLWAARSTVEALAKHHLGLAARDDGCCCTVASPDAWIRGAFDLAVPVEVRSPGDLAPRKLVLRCAVPPPHGMAESRHHPGSSSVDERMGCEVATHVWMQEKCPDIRIPHLYGFGFLGGRQVCSTRFARGEFL